MSAAGTSSLRNAIATAVLLVCTCSIGGSTASAASQDLPPAPAGKSLGPRAPVTLPDLSDYYSGTLFKQLSVMSATKPAGPGAPAPPTPAEWGPYSLLGATHRGVELWGYRGVVGQEILRRAAWTVDAVLRGCPEGVARRLSESKLRVVIMGEEQGLTDMPEFHLLRGRRTLDGRPWSSVRGVGPSRPVPWGRDLLGGRPTVAIGAEQVMDSLPNVYPGNMFVHELGHAVMSLGLTQCDYNLVKTFYQRAAASGVYGRTYMMTNEREYFAVATQAWFQAVGNWGALNDGVASRERLKKVDPDLAWMMAMAFGDVRWEWRGVFKRLAEPPPKGWGPIAGIKLETTHAPVAATHTLCKDSALERQANMSHAHRGSDPGALDLHGGLGPSS